MPHHLAELPAFLVQAVHRRGRRIYNAALKPLGLEARHVGVLGLLAASGPLIQRQIAEALDIDKSSVVTIVDDLERAGLAERRAAPRDRRAYAVRITERDAELFGWLPPEELAAFTATLRKLLARMPAD
jgi:DNA-binding MarR family transcriptional regulator